MNAAAPDEHMMRLYASGTFDRFTDRARRAVVLADQAAGSMGHDTVDTGHLLLGLIGEGEAVAAQALKAAGVTVEAATEAVCRWHPPGDAPPSGNRAVGTRLQKALELAADEAGKLGCRYIAAEHLLLGLIREGTGDGVLALVDCGPVAGDPGFLGVVRAKVAELLRGYTEAGEPATPAEAQASQLSGQHAFAWELVARMRKLLGHVEDMDAAREFGKALRNYQPCHCLCGHAHPADRGICTMDAVTSRHYDSPSLGPLDVPLCGPCAVAQGIEVPAGAEAGDEA